MRWNFLIFVATCLTTSVSAWCTSPADIHFLIDASMTVGPTNHQTQLNFVKHFCENFNININGTRVGITTFSSFVGEEFWMNKYADINNLKTGIDGVKWTAGTSHTEKGLDFVKDAFSIAHGGRDDVGNILIVMTDGKSSKPSDTVVAADSIHKEDINIFAIGIGNRYDKAEVEYIATNTDNALTVDSFDELNSIADSLANKVCEYVSPPKPTTSPSTAASATTATTTAAATTTPQLPQLHLVIDPVDIAVGHSTNVTLTCDARGVSSSLLAQVFLLQLNKVKADGSLTPIVELVTGGQQPIYMDDSLMSRSQVTGSLDVIQGVYLTIVIPDPLLTDADTYRCTMSYLAAHHHVPGLLTSDGMLKAWEMGALLVEIGRLKDLNLNLTRELDACMTP